MHQPELHLHVHLDAEVVSLLNKIVKGNKTIMATMQELRTAVERNNSLEDSVLTMLQGISQQLKDAQAQNDPKAIQDVIDQLDANNQRMADAVAANTPAENADQTQSQNGQNS